MSGGVTGPFDGAAIGVRELVAAIGGVFRPFGESVSDRADPLRWQGYPAQRLAAEERTGETNSVHCGHLVLGGRRAILIGFDFRFLGGSVGTVAGDRIVRAFRAAQSERLPVVSLVASGGTRIQEGMCALRQLHRIAEQCQLLGAAGLPHVAVLRAPTTGGMWASLAAGADVTLALPGAVVAFGGHRVRAESARTDAPGGNSDLAAGDAGGYSFTGEGKYVDGQIDQVVEPADLGAALSRWLDFLCPEAKSLRPAEVPRALGRDVPAADGWAAVRAARDPRRPRAAAYLADYFDQSVLISGDRAGGRDPDLLCGFGAREGRIIAFAAQTGTKTTPAGFRTATRLIRLAGRLRIPVLTLVDTPGAANDAEAERAGVGPAIAELFGVVATATVPITTLVIGEGGSGGALALCAPDRMWITPDGYFSVIAPELAAVILKRPPADVPDIADQLRLRPADLLDLGVVQGIATAENATRVG